MTPTKDVSKLDYLRHRPFLVITATTRPAANVHTNRKGWNEDRKNVVVTEQPMLVDRITTRHLREATVIVDILQDRLIKNRLLNASAVKIRDEVRKHQAMAADLKLRMKTMQAAELAEAKIEIKALKIMIAEMKRIQATTLPDVEHDNLQSLAVYNDKYSSLIDQAKNVWGSVA